MDKPVQQHLFTERIPQERPTLANLITPEIKKDFDHLFAKDTGLATLEINHQKRIITLTIEAETTQLDIRLLTTNILPTIQAAAKKHAYELNTAKKKSQLPEGMKDAPARATPEILPGYHNSIHNQLNPERTWENFLVDPSNNWAHEVFKSILDGKSNGLIYFTGRQGCGKSHLAQALAHELIKKNKDRIIYAPAGDFGDDYASMYSPTKLPPEIFNAKYKKATILILDDIHIIAHKPGAMKYLRQLISQTVDRNTIILISHKEPASLVTANEDNQELLGKISTTIKIDPPSPTLIKKLIAQHLSLNKKDATQLTTIVTQLHLSTRQISDRLLQINYLINGPTNSTFASALDATMSHNVLLNPKTLPDKIIELVCQQCGINENILKSNRKGNLQESSARHLAIYLLKKHTNLNNTAIAHKLNRDHSSVNYALKKMSRKQTIDIDFSNQIAMLEAKILS